MCLYTDTTIFSDEMDENNDRLSDTDTDTESSNDRQSSPSYNRYIYKYAPKRGVIGNNDEMLIFLKKKIAPKKAGDLQITFECELSKSYWSQPVVDLTIRDRMISFKPPTFPYQITKPTIVDIVLRQNDRFLCGLKYSYLPACRCK